MTSRDYVSEWKQMAEEAEPLPFELKYEDIYDTSVDQEPIKIFHFRVDPPAPAPNPIWLILSGFFIAITVLTLIL